MNVLEKKIKNKEQVMDIIKYLKFKNQTAMRFCSKKEAADYDDSIEQLVKAVTNFDNMLSELTNNSNSLFA